MALAVLSALTNIPVRNNVAMTGEITLRGRVLAVGGIKEKLLAAHRAGITKVLLPKECEADLEEIPQNVKEQMEFVLVEHMDELLPILSDCNYNVTFEYGNMRKSFIAESIRQFGIEVKIINLSDEVRISVTNAQIRQIMINSN